MIAENVQRRAAGWVAAWDGQGIPRPEHQVRAGGNQHPPSREGHLFADNTKALIDAVSGWLVEQHL
jgi:hypothetical protein